MILVTFHDVNILTEFHNLLYDARHSASANCALQCDGTNCQTVGRSLWVERKSLASSVVTRVKRDTHMEISPKMDEAFFWLCTCVFPLVVVVLLLVQWLKRRALSAAVDREVSLRADTSDERGDTSNEIEEPYGEVKKERNLGVLLVSFVIPLLLVIPLSGFVLSGVGISETPLAKAFCWSIEAIVLLAGAGMGALAVEENGNPWKGAKWGLWLAAIASFALVFLVNLVRIIGPGV